MKLGVRIPDCRHLATPDIIRATAVRAEQLGYDPVWVSDCGIGSSGAGVRVSLITSR